MSIFATIDKKAIYKDPTDSKEVPPLDVPELLAYLVRQSGPFLDQIGVRRGTIDNGLVLVFSQSGPCSSNISYYDANTYEETCSKNEFEEARDAEDAIRGRDGYDFDGHRLRVELAHGGHGHPSSTDRYSSYSSGRGGRGGGGRGGGVSRHSDYRVLVTGLPSSASWQDLKDHMRRAGDVCFSQVFRDASEFHNGNYVSVPAIVFCPACKFSTGECILCRASLAQMEKKCIPCCNMHLDCEGNRRSTSLLHTHPELLQFPQDMICYLLEDHISMKNGIQIYLAVVQNPTCFVYDRNQMNVLESLSLDSHFEEDLKSLIDC